jgi:hypothetical protein
VKAEGGIPGYVRSGGSYTVIASVSDDPSSNPPSGLATVQGTVAPGATAVALPASASSFGGQTYTHRSAAATVPAGYAAGSYVGSITATDAVVPPNSGTSNFTTVVDNTAPTRTSAAIANGGVVGRADAGDTISYLWSEIVDPQSVLPGWTGTSVPVTVRIDNFAGSRGDFVTVRNSANTAQLPLGTLETNVRDFVTALTDFGGPSNTTRSTMRWTAATGLITVTLGSADTPGTINTSGANTANFEWFPEAVYDRAGNLSTTTTFTETGALDREF